MSFDRSNIKTKEIQHLPKESPSVATLPPDPNATTSNDDFSDLSTTITEQPKDDINGILSITRYTNKSYVVYGEATKIHKESLKGLGCKYNSRLKFTARFPGGPGWWFSDDKYDDVVDFVNQVNNNNIETHNTIPEQGDKVSLPSVVVPIKQNKYQTVKWKVFIPKEGMYVTIKVGGAKSEGQVLQTETHRDVVDTCYVNIEGNTSKVVICNGHWQVWGYMVDHTVYFNDNTNNNQVAEI